MSDEGRPILPPAVGRVVAQVRQRLGALSRPVRVLLASTLVAALLVAGWLTWRSNTETWGVLYSQLERDDAGAIVNKLKELRIPYRLQSDGAVIEVPEARVPELRLEMATAGLPRGGGVGFEGFDRMRLGATEFEQRVMFRRALEGELARSIGSLTAVQSARVHLVMSERSVFVSRNDPASASIVVRLRPGHRVSRQEVAGIVHLVASSVPALGADHVTLVTTEGEMLHRPGAGESDAASNGGANGEEGHDPTAEQRAMQTAIEERTRAMLERVVGEGHVDVRASVEMDHARVERAEDHYDRNSATLRSEEQTLEQIAGTVAPPVTGVPGAESNLGNGAATVPVVNNGRDAGVVREQHTRNYEIDHVSERRVATQGTLKRVTVAVVVDGVVRYENGRPRVVPRDAEELERIRALVRGSVGASESRGDVVSVESIPFQTTIDTVPRMASGARRPAPAPRFNRTHLGALAGVAVVLLLVGAAALRRRRRAAAAATASTNATASELALSPATAATSVTLSPVPGYEAAPPSTELAPHTDPAVPPPDPEAVRDALRAEVHARVLADPASAALVLRYWLGSEEAAPATANAQGASTAASRPS